MKKGKSLIAINWRKSLLTPEVLLAGNTPQILSKI